MLAGKKVVVVGGSSGIGLATAELARREGATVMGNVFIPLAIVMRGNGQKGSIMVKVYCDS